MSFIFIYVNITFLIFYLYAARPWFVETSAPIPKDIVLVLDKSESMNIEVPGNKGVTRLRLAAEAAKSVMSTLSQNDRVRLLSHRIVRYLGRAIFVDLKYIQPIVNVW